MVNKVLSLAGFEEGKTCKETRFIKPPRSSYALYMDSFTRRGGDDANLIKEHSYTIELYCYLPDPDAEARIENALDSYELKYDKSERYWIQEEQLFQIVYTFDYIEK